LRRLAANFKATGEAALFSAELTKAARAGDSSGCVVIFQLDGEERSSV
jgi:hypothetical protein